MEIATFICIVLLNVGLVVSTFHNRRQDKRIAKLQEAVVLLMTKPEPKKPVYNYTITHELDPEELRKQLEEHLKLQSYWQSKSESNHQKYMDQIWTLPVTNGAVAAADIYDLLKAMPKKEADQLADVIQLHGDKITDKKDDNNE